MYSCQWEIPPCKSNKKMMDLESFESSSSNICNNNGSFFVKKTLISDISTFTSSFKDHEFVSLSLFHTKWCEMDLSLLRLVAPFDLIIWSMGQVGLFSPTRPYRDHQVLLFLLAFFYKLQQSDNKDGKKKSPIRLSLERAKLLKSINDKAEYLGQSDIIKAFNYLWFSNGITILVDDTDLDSHFNIFNTVFASSSIQHRSHTQSSYPEHNPPNHNLTTELITDRIRRIETFLQSNDPFADKCLSKANLIKIQQLLKRYEESKLLSTTDAIRSQNIESVLDSLIKLVNDHQNGSNYRNEVKHRRKTLSHPTLELTQQPPYPYQSVRTRLSQSITQLTPAVPPFNSNDTFRLNLNRSQSVPAGKMNARKTSLNSNTTSHFLADNNNNNHNHIEYSTTTNMPNINFY